MPGKTAVCLESDLDERSSAGMNVQRLLCLLLQRTGMAAAARRLLTRKGRMIVTFHGVASEPHAALRRADHTPFTAAQLRDTVTWIADRFRLLTPEELLAGNVPGVLLTFDDGFANAATNALPVLEAFHAHAVFFVAGFLTCQAFRRGKA